MNTSKLKLLVISGVFFALTAGSPAPINDRPPDFKPTPERTEQQLMEEQKLQRAQGEVGGVEVDTEPNRVESDYQDPNAASVVGETGQSAEEVLIENAKPLQEKHDSPGKKAFWGFLFLLMGLGLALGLRSWAAKNAPDFPKY